ncbi:MAG TPA: nitroreductase/quinone reductase family protein [Jatrophihabitans sp.]|jgi:deazaflavin-dependent oxidoreductase (nitroreductase family)|uniref:nitroreductase/quinone reductase family protein n=1 Tax=Jatrophihabitans sp. TaxID=1932789 RepID=UPI002E0A1847|nr:nitroreductase/quinone reductase family protein [Jatrophihabitans sp.]
MSETSAPKDMREFNRNLVEKFRETGGIGELGPVDFGSLVLLTTTGRRSGEPRTVPLGAARDAGDDLLLFASNMGAAQEPDWCRNLRDDPHVTVEITGLTWETDAVILEGAERDDAYRRWIEMAPHVAAHEEQAGRTIPMVRIPAS